MAYGLKYRSELFTRNGHTFRLCIYEDGFVGNGVTTIGNLQSLALEVQGGSEGIDAPIIKTSLSWSMADEQDKGLVDGVRYGHWEDLYTADSTRFKVVLQRDGSDYWTGYLTPDSWHDQLQYNSYIGFTARDNIGHLQDFEYAPGDISGGGMASVESIMETALAKIGFGMDLSVYDKTKWLKSGTNNGYEGFLVDTSIFIGKSWYQVLESVLAGFGLVFRFIGGNAFGLCPLRYLPVLGGTTTRTAQFVSRSGVRELSPAYKQIVETGSYELCPDDTPVFLGGDFTKSGDTYTLTKAGWTASKAGVLRPYDEDIESTLGYTLVPVPGEKDRFALLRAWSSNGGTLTHTVRVGNNTGISLAYSFRGLFQRNAGAWVNNPLLAARRTRVNVYVMWTDALGATQYLNADGQWQDAQAVAAAYESQNAEDAQANKRAWNTDGSISLTTPDTAGSLAIRFEATADMRSAEYDGMYLLLGAITASIESATIPNGWKITTIYDDTQNTTLKRDIDFGIVPTWCKSAGTISNGIYLAEAVSGVTTAYNAQWGGETPSLPIPVLNALQILAMHAKANSVFTGELRAADGSEITLGERWTAYGKSCLLVGGTLDLMTGRVTSAKLVEYDTYSDIWGGITDIDYSAITGGEGNYGNASPSGSSAAGSAGSAQPGGNISVGLEMPEAFEVGNSPVRNSGTIAVALAAGYAIPTVAQLAILDMFGYDAENNAVYVKNGGTTARSFYAYGAVTAGGIGSGGSGGGSIVSWTQRTTSGTKIATITIDGVPTDVYAPNAGISSISVLTIGNKTYDGSVAVTVGSSDIIAALGYTPYNATNPNGYTSNTGTVTSVAVKMNGTVKGTVTGSGTIDLGTVITAHQSLAAYLTSATAASTYLALAGGTMTGGITFSGASGNKLTFVGGETMSAYGNFMFGSSSASWNIFPYNSTSAVFSVTKAGAVTAASFAKSGGTSSQFLKADGSVDSNTYLTTTAAANTYLPLAGGTLDSGSTSTTLHLRSATSDLQLLGYVNSNYIESGNRAWNASQDLHITGYNDTQMTALYLKAATIYATSSNYTVYHSGNCNKSTASWSASDMYFTGSLIKGNHGDFITVNTTGWASTKLLTTSYLSGIGDYTQLGVIGSTDHSSAFIRLIANGNVGIGTTNPGFKLDVAQTGSVWSGHFISDNSAVYLAHGGGSGFYVGKKGTTGYLMNLMYNQTSLGSGGTSALYVGGSGNVGIGTESPTQKLHVVGNIVATGAITAGSSSDARLKTNVRKLANAIKILKALRAVEFDWNEEAEKHYSALKGHDVGLIAQEVEPLIPSAIGTIFEKYKRLDYTKVTPYLIAGWQSHEERIAALEKENKELKQRIQHLIS